MIEELEKTIIQNIKKIPEVPLSLLLSGGIDSSLVLALLRRTYPRVQISTFTLAKSKDYPDVAFARQIADLFETEHNEIILSVGEYEKLLREYNEVKRYDFRGDINVYILCSFAKTFSSVIVTGDGGDECFGGYWLHEYPLGHREMHQIECFEEIHPDVKEHLQQMVDAGFRDFLYKEKSAEEDYDSVWEYFVKIMAPRHLAPLLHTAEILNVEVSTPLFSESILSFMRTLSYREKIGRRAERKLASMYLPSSIVERESIGFDMVLETK